MLKKVMLKMHPQRKLKLLAFTIMVGEAKAELERPSDQYSGSLRGQAMTEYSLKHEPSQWCIQTSLQLRVFD